MDVSKTARDAYSVEHGGLEADIEIAVKESVGLGASDEHLVAVWTAAA